jgi:CRISPR-associated protein Csb1
MSDLLTRYDYLLDENGPAAIVLQQWLKPADGDIIFPPTYAAPSQKKGDPPVYNIDRFGESSTLRKSFEKLPKVHTFMDAERTEQGREHSVCVIDSIASQVNRIEPLFADRIAEGKLVPQVAIKVKVKNNEGNQEEQIVNLLQAGHRAADAIVRFSTLAPDLEKAIKARAHGDSLLLAKLAPTSLIFGMWDSRSTGVKVPRLINSIIRAYDAIEFRRSAQYFPATDYEAAGVVAEKGEEGLKKLSDEVMAEVPATFTLGGIEAKGGIRRDASINLVTLRDIVTSTKKHTDTKTETDADKSRQETRKLQRYLLGLALVVLTWSDGKTLNLRQGCQLVAVPDKPMVRACINPDGSQIFFEIDRDTAVQYAMTAAVDFSVGESREAMFDPQKAKQALKKKGAKEAKS